MAERVKRFIFFDYSIHLGTRLNINFLNKVGFKLSDLIQINKTTRSNHTNRFRNNLSSIALNNKNIIHFVEPPTTFATAVQGMQILLLLSTPTVLARKFSCSVVSIWKLLQLNLHLLRFCCPPTASELYRLTLTSFWLTLGAVAWLFFVAFFPLFAICRFHFPIPVRIPVCVPVPVTVACACLSVHCGAVVGDSRRKSSYALEQCNPLPGSAPCSRTGQAHRYTRRTEQDLQRTDEVVRALPAGEWRMAEQNRMRCWLLWKAHKTKLRKTRIHDIQAANEPETKQFYDIRRVASRRQSLRKETPKGNWIRQAAALTLASQFVLS